MRTIHITNGGAAAGKMERAGLDGDIRVFADALHAGRVPPMDDITSWIEARARFADEAGFASYDEALRMLREWQEAFDNHAEYDRIVLWLEHDLFDQLHLIRHLAFLTRAGRTDGVELVQSDDYLGPMDPEQLAQLYPTRQTVTTEQFETATKAWDVFVSIDHSGFNAVDAAALPFLASAIQRILDEHPSVQSALGRTDRTILQILNDTPMSFGTLFTRHTQAEDAFFMGDSVFDWHLRELQDVGLVEFKETFQITERGGEVLAGKLEKVGIKRWLGGVLLDL